MDRAKLDGWCEKGILAFILAIVVFGPLATGAVRTLEFLVIQWLTLGAAGLWLARLWISPKPLLLWPPICWAVLAFVAYAVVRCSLADVEYLARKEMIRVLVYACLFFIILNNLNRQDSTQILIASLIVLGTLISAYAIYQFAVNSPKVWHFVKPAGYLKRAGGTFINPNHLAGFLEMLLPISLAGALLGRFSHALKIVLGYVSLVMMAGIGVTISRGGCLATGVVLLFFFSLTSLMRGLRIVSISLLLLLVVAGGTFAVRSEMMQKRLSGLNREKTADVRSYFWSAATRMWKDHFWCGVGPGHYDDRYRQYREPVWQAQGRPVNAHNDYLNTLAEWGTIGLGLVVTALVLLGVGIFRTWEYVKRSPNDLETKRSNRTAFVFGATLGLLALLLHAVVEFNLQIPANAILAVTLMALLSGYRRYATEQFWVSPGLVWKIVFTATLLLGLGYLTFCSVRSFREYRWLARAQATASPQKKIAAWKKAHQVDPRNTETTYNIGETLRLLSWEGNRDYKKLAEEALPWFEPGMRLHRWNPYNFMRYGMCLDWLGRQQEATPYFEKMRQLDPNGFYVLAHLGWHYFQMDDYVTAKIWLERSLAVYGNHNNRSHMAVTYLRLVNERLAEQETTQRLP